MVYFLNIQQNNLDQKITKVLYIVISASLSHIISQKYNYEKYLLTFKYAVVINVMALV